MAHPNRKEAQAGHNAKLKRMTEDYGDASGPTNNISNPQTRAGGKEPGPEPAIGFGADSNRPRGRADRASRKQGVSNPVATMKRGGAAKRAHGGRTKHKGKGTHVNVIVAPQGGGGAPPVARPVAAVPPVLPRAVAPPAPPPRPPMGAGPMAAGPMPGGGAPPPMAPGAPGGIPPGLMPPRKRGGRVHPDKSEDKKLIHKILKDEGLVRSGKPAHVRASGGRLPNQKHHMDAGAGSGEGRLEKIGEKVKTAGAPQAV